MYTFVIMINQLITANNQFDYLVKTTWQNIYNMYSSLAAEFDGTVATAFALISINPVEGSLSTEIGPRMGIAATSISRILNTLEEKKLIKKHPNTADGRSVIVKLTKKGKEMRDISKKTILGFNKMVSDELSSVEIENFYTTMNKINTIIEKYKVHDQQKSK